MSKERLDKILVDLGYFETRQKAQAAIMAQDVKINGETITKAGFQLEVTDKNYAFCFKRWVQVRKSVK